MRLFWSKILIHSDQLFDFFATFLKKRKKKKKKNQAWIEFFKFEKFYV